MIKIIMANLYEKQKTEKYSLYQMAIQRFLGSIFSNIIIGTKLIHFWKLFNFNKKPSPKYKIKISLSDPKDTAAKRIES